MVMMLPHLTEVVCLLCIDNEHFRSVEVPTLRNGSHTVSINEVLEHGFFRFAWFIFTGVTELKLLSGLSISYIRFQVLNRWYRGPSRFKIIYKGVQNIAKKAKLEPQVAFPTLLYFVYVCNSSLCSFRTVHWKGLKKLCVCSKLTYFHFLNPKRSKAVFELHCVMTATLWNKDVINIWLQEEFALDIPLLLKKGRSAFQYTCKH